MSIFFRSHVCEKWEITFNRSVQYTIRPPLSLFPTNHPYLTPPLDVPDLPDVPDPAPLTALSRRPQDSIEPGDVVDELYAECCYGMRRGRVSALLKLYQGMPVYISVVKVRPGFCGPQTLPGHARLHQRGQGKVGLLWSSNCVTACLYVYLHQCCQGKVGLLWSSNFTTACL